MRITLFMRRGFNATDADDLADLADLLHMRDTDGDDRVLCVECSHFRPGRCLDHRRAGLDSPEVGRQLATMPQRCAAFEPGGGFDMIAVLLSGRLVGDPERRTGPSGKAYALARLATTDSAGAEVLTSVIAFGEVAEQLAALSKGESASVAGRAKLSSWTGRDGTQRAGLSITADALLSVHHARKRRRAMQAEDSPPRRPAPARGRSARLRRPAVKGPDMTKTASPAPRWSTTGARSNWHDSKNCIAPGGAPPWPSTRTPQRSCSRLPSAAQSCSAWMCWCAASRRPRRFTLGGRARSSARIARRRGDSWGGLRPGLGGV